MEFVSGVPRDRLDRKYRDACEAGEFKLTLCDLESMYDEVEMELMETKEGGLDGELLCLHQCLGVRGVFRDVQGHPAHGIRHRFNH